MAKSHRGEKDDFGKIERREKAVAFLDNPELLMMYAQSTGDVSSRLPPFPLQTATCSTFFPPVPRRIACFCKSMSNQPIHPLLS